MTSLKRRQREVKSNNRQTAEMEGRNGGGEGGGEEAKPTPNPQEAALKNRAAPQPGSVVL